VGEKTAIIAVAYSTPVIAYHILKRGGADQELGADYPDRRAPEGPAHHLTCRLQHLGFSVTLTDTAATL